MMFLAGISSLSFVFATMVLFWWHSALEVRVGLAGVYFLIGTVATIGTLVLFRSEHGGRSQAYERGRRHRRCPEGNGPI
jgi:hypothetical protein